MLKGYSRRRTDRRKEGTIFLIICEGQKTERTYFGRYKERNSGLIIFAPNSTDTDPENLVEFAISQMQRYGIDYDNGDEVWCVFDADNNPGRNIEKAQKKAKAQRINLCLSNPCFELWYLLHFCYYDTAITARDLQSKLAEKISKYDKTNDYFDSLKGKRETAIRNANRLNKKQMDAGIELLSMESNPSTQVVKLVENMLKIIENNLKRE